jgi:alkylation response protein AidB-like acyl-CoA dehydrogenase
VDFALSSDQRDLAAAVRDLISAHADLGVVRSVVDDPDSDGDPNGLWRRMADQGWPALLVPERHGGLGLDLLDAAVVARELGAGVVPSPFIGCTVAARALTATGDALQERWLPALAEGSARIAVALDDPGAAVDRVGAGVSAASGRLTGTVRQVEYAHLADRVLTVSDDGAVWLVDPAGEGADLARTPLLDGTTRTSTLVLDGAPGEQLTGADPVALRLAATALYANDLAGIARSALDRTAEYLRTREQFGRPIGAFQALQHAMADLLVDVTMAEHTAWFAAHALDVDAPDAAQAVSVAKAKTGDTAAHVTQGMIQYHGGIGFTWEHDAHLYFKRALRENQVLGDPAQHRELIARMVTGV